MMEAAVMSALARSFSAAGLERPKMIQFDGVWGIFRVQGAPLPKALEAANASGPLTTVRTSGTLRTLREAPELAREGGGRKP